MARSFDPTDAKRLIETHQRIQKKLADVQKLSAGFTNEIMAAADKLVAAEVLEVLRGIPIEELNRGKRGLKTKALRDHGYRTIADISTASVFQIASVYGVSEDSAYTIRRIVKGLVDQARKDTKIHISSDNRSPSATDLVVALASLRRIGGTAAECEQMLNDYRNSISYAIGDLMPGTSRLKWLFSSKSTKDKGEKAFLFLGTLLKGSYGEKAKWLLSQVNEIKRMPADKGWEDFQQNSIQFFNLLERIAPGVLGQDDGIYGLPEEIAAEVQDEAFFPNGLLCDLRRYQEWGVKYILHQERVLLGDEMGLGKTVQAIATMVSLKNTGATHFIVVCPASVITNWCREIAGKSRLRVTRVHGSGRSAALKAWKATGGVAVTTYETVGHFKLEDDFKYSLLTVDEAHYVKNAEARRTVNVKELSEHAERILFMTGTALENNVDEMIALIQMLQPAVAAQVKGLESLSAAPQFRKKVAPVYYRRKREDVLSELPDKIESKEWCVLSPEEESIYETAILAKHYAEAWRVSWNIDDLRNSSKARRMMEIIEDAKEDGRKVIVFSFFLDTIRSICHLLGDQCLNPINGSVHPTRRQEIIDEFEKAPAGTVLAAQIQSGGTGLNIQSASVVILCEPQFKPSVEDQAISRAYRMGQTRNVQVFRLLCENTVDEKITERLDNKRRIFNAFADKSEAARESIQLDDKAFGDIIKEEIDRINAKRSNGSKEENNKSKVE